MRKAVRHLLLGVASFSLIFSFFGAFPGQTSAVGGCFDYGPFAMETLSGYCECMSGYVFQDDPYLGTRCVDADTVCTDQYGYGAKYDSLSESCECKYGYVFGEDMFGNTECITESDACKDQLGIHARAGYGDTCECSYGYVIHNGKCTNGDSVCTDKHGYNSSYDSLDNACECDEGYTFDDNNKCVEKQNNVYFKLLDINDSTDELLVKSDYSGRKYILEYGLGCSLYVDRYLGKNLVINLGTDFDVDYWDTIVLQDHDATCDITSVETTFEDSFSNPIKSYEAEAILYNDPVATPPPVVADEAIEIEKEVTLEEPTQDFEEIIEEEVEEAPKKKRGIMGFFKRLFGRG
jgi:hypothetical protein